MEISKGIFKIESKTNHTPCDVEVMGLSVDNNVIFMYKINETIHYTLYSPERKMQNYIFFELINKSLLWSITFDIVSSNSWSYTKYFDVKFSLKINRNMISEYNNTSTSLALNFLFVEQFIKSPFFSDTDFTNKSIIPYCDPINPPNNFKVNLYDYQQRTLAKMIQIEKNQTDFSVDYTFNINFHGVDIIFDPISNLKVDKKHKFKIKTTGGILSDEMGLGKTISSIALIASNPAPNNLPQTKKSLITNIEKINSRATVVLCPSHLTKQWESEILRCIPSLKIKIILTKNDYNGLIFEDFIQSDVIITSHQFIMNFKFYPTLHYHPCTASSFNFSNRNASIKQYLQEKLTKSSFSEITKLSTPIFEFFNFHRLILDEGHEIFSEMLGTIALGKYMSTWVSNIDSNSYWYVSGTPFINSIGVKNCAKFINLRLEDSERNLTFDCLNTSSDNQPYSDSKNTNFLSNLMNKEYIWNNILDKICIRHRKTDVETQIKILGYQEQIIWLKFTELERQLYDAKKGKVDDKYLQQLCCHPLVVESSKKIFGDVEVDLSLMQDKLISYHKNNYELYKKKLSQLDSTRPEYYMLKKTYETQISESKYLFTILEKMSQPDIINNENCSVCMCSLDNPTMTKCGHIFCYECLKMCLATKKQCPLCKTNLQGEQLLVVNGKKNNENNDLNNPLIHKYGSKLGKLITIIRQLVAQDDVRIIVFSQWDDMLTLIGKTLAENEIENCFVKGNVWSRNLAIRKFKEGKTIEGSDNKVIMLSLKNAASGTNLTEATHIFFVEPINASREESRAIESQAIARACRVGQKQKIMLMRILIEQTIEEEIYRTNYNKDVVVSFENKEYIIGESNVKNNENKEIIVKKSIQPKTKRIKKISNDIEI